MYKSVVYYLKDEEGLVHHRISPLTRDYPMWTSCEIREIGALPGLFLYPAHGLTAKDVTCFRCLALGPSGSGRRL